MIFPHVHSRQWFSLYFCSLLAFVWMPGHFSVCGYFCLLVPLSAQIQWLGDKLTPECLQWKRSRRPFVLLFHCRSGSTEAWGGDVAYVIWHSPPLMKSDQKPRFLTLCAQQRSLYGLFMMSCSIIVILARSLRAFWPSRVPLSLQSRRQIAIHQGLPIFSLL